jgi:phosphate/phosphite/phosphonate ABC transporter binding protein
MTVFKYSLNYFIVLITLLCSFTLHAQTLYLGSIGDDPDGEIKEFNSLAVYLQKHLSDAGIDKVKTIVASNEKEMVNLIAKQKVHLYIDSPFPSLIAEQEAGSTIFLRRWKKGVAEYRSVIFARKDSGIDSLEKLQGKIIAFENPFSTSSYFLPKATLLEKGLKLKEVSLGDTVPDDTTGYLFSDNDQNTMLWVLRRKAQIGAMNEANYIKLAKKKLKELIIIETSIYVPRHVVSYAPGMNKELVQAIAEVLKNMNDTEEGRAALMIFSKTTRFDEFPGGVEKQMAPLKELLKYQY